jgi:hypothetical protein
MEIIHIQYLNCRDRHQKHYSVVVITLRYVFALSHNASTLRRKVIASYSYRSTLKEIVIASYSYRFGSKGIEITTYSYRSTVGNKSVTVMRLTDLTLITTATHACRRGVDGSDPRVR